MCVYIIIIDSVLLLWFQGYGDISEEDLNKTYIDIVLNIFENDIGWFSFEGLDTQITYQNIIDSIINNLQSSLPNDNNIEVNKYF